MFIVEVGNEDLTVAVIKNENGTYDVLANDVVRHPGCDPEAAMRALGNYLHSALYQVEAAKPKVAPEHLTSSKTEWHDWFCWYPVYSIEYGWVWLRHLNRKAIPENYVSPVRCRKVSEKLSETLTGCWHRIPDCCP